MISAFYDTETLIRDWLTSTAVAALVTRGDGGISIFKAMPLGAPIPSVVLSRVGGGPKAGSDMGEDIARISFACWAGDRNSAVQLSRELVAACENLAPQGGYATVSARLAAAEVVSWMWLPDPASDVPRYVVDALFTTIPG